MRTQSLPNSLNHSANCFYCGESVGVNLRQWCGKRQVGLLCLLTEQRERDRDAVHCACNEISNLKASVYHILKEHKIELMKLSNHVFHLGQFV